MPRKKRAPWIKLFGDYASSPSHSELDDRALWTGVALMQLIRAGCDARDDREYWALQQSGKPCSVYAIAQQARQPHAIAQRGLNLLVDAGTAERRESDGAYGIPNFWRFQETPDAARKRNKGGKSAPDSTPESAPPSGVALTLDVRGKSVLFENTPVVPAGDLTSASDAKPRRGKPRADFPEGLDLWLLNELNAAIERVHGARARKRKITAGDRDDLRKLYASEEPTPEDVTHVIGVREGMDRRREGYGELSWSHLCVPKNFRRYLERKSDPGPEGGPPSAHLSIDEIRRMEAEETDAAR